MERGAIILCGGRSTRMGRDKWSLPFGLDETMLQRVARLVSDAVPAERIVCVAACEGPLPKLPISIEILRDPEPHRGPLAGLATGLAALAGKADAAFACGCDVPLLVPALVERMFAELGEEQIAVPHDGERFHPLAAVYRIEVQVAAESLLATGQRSLRALVGQCPTRCVPTDALRDVDPALDSLATCNTEDEYHALVKRAGIRTAT